MAKGTEMPAAVFETLDNRASFYDLLALFYRNALTQDQIDLLASFDYSSFDLENDLLRDGFDDIRRYLRKRNTGTRQALATEYTSVFAGVKTYEGKSAIPCASLFVDGLAHFYAEQHRVVYGIYKKECVRVADGVNLPADHLAFELEFLGMMGVECREALEKGDVARAMHKLEVSESFIRENILNWFDSFEEVAMNIIQTRFYRGVLRITKGWLQLDLETIADVRGMILDHDPGGTA